MTNGHRAFAEKVYDIFNRGAADELDPLFAADFVEHQELPVDSAGGIAAVKAWLRMWRQAFPDASFEMLDIVGEGDTLCVRLRATGTHKGDFMGMPATGRRFDVEGYDWVRLDVDGKVVEHWGAAEDMKMMTQLGAIPDQRQPVDVTDHQHTRA